MSRHRELPENSPIVNVAWIAKRAGITPGAVRKHLKTHANPQQPYLIPDVLGLNEYAFTPAVAEAWIEAYKAAPKRGRRGDGSVRRKGRKVKDGNQA